MMGRRVTGWLLGGVLLGAGPAFALSPKGECNKTFEVGGTGTAGGSGTEIDSLSTTPSKLCNLDCFAVGANGWAAAWDTPSSDETGNADVGVRHPQAKLIAERGAATAGNSDGTGEVGRYTEFGLTVETYNCRATGSYKD